MMWSCGYENRWVFPPMWPQRAKYTEKAHFTFWGFYPWGLFCAPLGFYIELLYIFDDMCFQFTSFKCDMADNKCYKCWRMSAVTHISEVNKMRTHRISPVTHQILVKLFRISEYSPQSNQVILKQYKLLHKSFWREVMSGYCLWWKHTQKPLWSPLGLFYKNRSGDAMVYWVDNQTPKVWNKK